MNIQAIIKIYFGLASVLLLVPKNSFCQDKDSANNIVLPSVIIKAFEQNRELQDVPAAVNYIGRNTFDHFASTSIVSAINSTPGVRMEERSPGSYRMNIRGSSLRSPFGVRNVKIYYNDIPYTDPGGQSYFNQLGSYNFNSIEIIKGPNNSLYGAGTGGVMLIESLSEKEKPGIFGEYSTGSYSLQNMYASLVTAPENAINKIGFQHQQSSGYRDHSKLKRDVFAWNGLLRMGENRLLKTTFLYGDLFYETPGALTKAEFDVDAKAARPGVGAIPGAVASNASIHQKMFIAGASYAQPITSNLQNKTTLYGMFTELRNPAISSYGKNSEPHFGGRTVFKYARQLSIAKVTVDAGYEIQQGLASVSIFKNVAGNADSLRTQDEINNRQQTFFIQLLIDRKDWTVLAGASWNILRVGFQRFSPATQGNQVRTFNNEIAPRFTVMKKFGEVHVYAGIAKGFSPPTTAELLPTGGDVNLGLNAEEGLNYEAGTKAIFFKDLYIDINAFSYALKNTIVLRRTANGSDYYINAGSTKQHGIETYASYPLFRSSPAFKNGSFWVSHTWHDFHYKEFKQLTNDFSGNRLPSVAPHTVSTGMDVALKNGLLATVSYYFSDKIALNDANSEYANAYHLIGAKFGYEKLTKKKTTYKIIFGGDNLLNEVYSLGNDINGFGGRYYNAAAGRNFYVSFSFQFLKTGNHGIIPG